MECYPGRFDVNEKAARFISLGATDDQRSAARDFEWAIPELREVGWLFPQYLARLHADIQIHYRRFCLRPVALEFFLIDQSNFFLAFEDTMRELVCHYQH